MADPESRLAHLREHRNQVFADLEAPGKVSLGGAVAAKRVADLYLALAARKRWPQFKGGDGPEPEMKDGRA